MRLNRIKLNTNYVDGYVIRNQYYMRQYLHECNFFSLPKDVIL